ncbi:MAG: hypothetical protein GXY34_07390 [Syntrophomonadaceae bacterium]|nr:hypothetical protein [Syntrophomonadaceae bacterium]
MTDTQEAILYVIASLQNQNQSITLDALRQPFTLMGYGEVDIAEQLGGLAEMGLVYLSVDDQFRLTELGQTEANRIYKIKAREEFSSFIERASASPAYLDFCRELYGYRLPLFNMMDQEQLDFVFNSIPLSGSDIVLDLGCGPASILNHLVNKYGCQGIGIDQIDWPEAAMEGSVFYIQGDIDSFLDYQITSTVCLAVDSLYFTTDLPALISKLRSIPQNRLYLFYSQYIFDPGNKDQSLLHADHTRLAAALHQAGLSYQTIDYSTNERMLYENGLKILPKYRDLFEAEGNMRLYEKNLQEYSMGKDLYDRGMASRFLYVVLMNDSKIFRVL